MVRLKRRSATSKGSFSLTRMVVMTLRFCVASEDRGRPPGVPTSHIEQAGGGLPAKPEIIAGCRPQAMQCDFSSPRGPTAGPNRPECPVPRSDLSPEASAIAQRQALGRAAKLLAAADDFNDT